MNLSPQGKRFCETPRGERVRSGHFVKAYRFRNGFSDIPCQVQLRLCVEGNLEGTYQMPSCKPRMTSWEDFRDGYLDGEEPSIPRLMKMLEKEFVDNAEMSRLQQEVADQMRQYLRDFD